MRAAIFVAALLFALPAMAQQPKQQQIDPRLTAPMMAVLRANVALRDAAIQALTEDAAKREAEWAEYSKPLWQSPPKGK